jgi:hypothetical protein
MNKTPILLLIFNRPFHTKQVFESVRKYKPKKLYISADGPRENNISDLVLCKETRGIIDSIDWECELVTNFFESNKGCRSAVYEGITWFFQQEERGIILEDDILPEPSFFEYCHKSLEYYENKMEIGIICGMNFAPQKINKDSILYSQFSNYAFIWGWATWRRTWDLYDPDLNEWDGDYFFLKKIKYINSRIIDVWVSLFDLVKYHNYNTWDYQLNFLLFKYSLLSVVPSENLIDNIGFGINSTHTKELKPQWLKPYKPNIKEFILTSDFDSLQQNKEFTKRVFADNYYNILKFVIKKTIKKLFINKLIISKKKINETR